jgi:hypothetical protein
MGQGSYCICEWDSIQKNNVEFQRAVASLDARIVQKCNTEWAPRRFNMMKAFSPDGESYGRVPILPALFDDHNQAQITTASWRQLYTSAGHQMVLQGSGSGEIIPEDFKIAWIGMFFPNKQQHFSEFKWQIGDRKYGRINVEEMHSYNKPAVIFEEGYVLDEEESFHLYGYLEGDIPVEEPFIAGLYQSVGLLGAAYFKITSKVLGNCGAAI